ncbi:hypothetical protein Bbelb_304640 [Branchiostoma belcheri]|nr:hypothetical protein Bbelb_304640 [Branchiostoma belcheri]
MAGKIQELDDVIDDQFLTCAVCKLHFRDPRILPCLHTFCKECLEIWATKQQPLECPTCRKHASLPDQGVNGLRTNIYVNNLLDFAAVKKGAGPGVPCQVCEGKEGVTRAWCVQCAILLCESCTNTHNRFPTMKGHQIVNHENLKATEFQRKAFCSKHEDQVLTFYCEPCQTLVCAACALVDHRLDDEHKPVEVGDIAEKKKLDLQELLGKVDARASEAQTVLNNVEKEISELPTSIDAAIEQATVCFDHLVTLLQDRKTEVINNIESDRQEFKKSLETQKEAMEFELSGLTSASEFCKQALEHGSDAHVIVAEGQARQRVEELLTTPTDLTVRPSQVVFSEGTAVAVVRRNMKKAGCVKVTSKVDASKCSVEVNPAIVDFSSFTLLRTLDKNGHLCFVPKDDVTITLKDFFGQNVQTRMQEKGRGLWKISYIPKVTGNHTLEVKVNGQPLAGSPFYVKVRKAIRATRTTAASKPSAPATSSVGGRSTASVGGRSARLGPKTTSAGSSGRVFGASRVAKPAPTAGFNFSAPIQPSFQFGAGSQQSPAVFKFAAAVPEGGAPGEGFKFSTVTGTPVPAPQPAAPGPFDWSCQHVPGPRRTSKNFRVKHRKN